MQIIFQLLNNIRSYCQFDCISFCEIKQTKVGIVKLIHNWNDTVNNSYINYM